ncbi:MAG: hypothetical protein R6X02_04545 [Enhygromyxa sp.]
MRSKLALIMVATLAGGCSFFDDDDGDDEVGDTGEVGDGDGDDDPPPTQGFRVFPKFMLQDLSAIVTIEIDGITPTPCELDLDQGGYVCDAGELPADSSASVWIEKDGFEGALRRPMVVFNQIIPLEVHLAVEGGPSGSWSSCAAAGEFETCAELCASFEDSCLVTSCATEQEDWPIATYETYSDADCTTPLESLALGCESSLPVTGTVASLRCCCAG